MHGKLPSPPKVNSSGGVVSGPQKPYFLNRYYLLNPRAATNPGTRFEPCEYETGNPPQFWIYECENPDLRIQNSTGSACKSQGLHNADLWSHNKPGFTNPANPLGGFAKCESGLANDDNPANGDSDLRFKNP